MIGAVVDEGGPILKGGIKGRVVGAHRCIGHEVVPGDGEVMAPTCHG